MNISSKKLLALRNNRAGNTLLVALLMLAVLSVVGATVLQTVSTRYNYSQKAVGWSEALNAAEAGADYALANCRWTLSPTSSASPSPTPPSAWTGWKKGVYNAPNWVAVTNTADANSELGAGRTISYDLPAGSHLVTNGEGTTDLWYHVEVDSPPSFVVNGNRWYRIRSTGYAGLPGSARANEDFSAAPTTHNEILRKFDLLNDHFIMRYGDYSHPAGATVAVASPQATRRVEVIARPQTTGKFALATTGPDTPNVPLVDSWDPSNNVLLYPLGLYTSIPRQTDPLKKIGTNSTVYINAPISSYSGLIYGNLQTNNGTVVKTNNISGRVINAAPQVTPPVNTPGWTVATSGGAPAIITAGTTARPSRGSYSKIDLPIVVTLPVGQTSGIADIYVSGDITAGITVALGVTARIWFAGNVNVRDSDIVNANVNAPVFNPDSPPAQNLQLYGIDPLPGATRTINIQGTLLGPTPKTSFVLDAPAYDMTVQGTLLSTDLEGSFVVRSMNASATKFHYDERLATAGVPLDYSRASWVEDPR